ncbi:YkvA family protein [Pontibacter arcticus]|uniref:DUF1232 domain-containing protein n=1 Tax=Pontibacter arcticus TaxID=2080288 RepID=A0A364RGD1_9BACT|nr:DUF1232 domain-containing protein [Pontibacter arcticus]RAU83332.1 DUF1232 domain-containing protein [Pontibacter arcticus]
MLNDWIQRGLTLSQNPLFQKFLGRAGGVIAKPVKLGYLFTQAYNKLIDVESNKSGFEQIKEVLHTFIRLGKAYADGSYRDVESKSMLIGVAVILYLVTPLDIIPDFLPAIGLLDDLSLIAWFISSFQKEIDKFKKWEEHRYFEPQIGTL